MKKDILILVILFSILTGCKINQNNHEYTKEELEQLILPGRENTLQEKEVVISEGISVYHGVNEDNIVAYRAMLQNLDEMIGKDKYQITSVFETHHKIGEIIEISYIMYIVPEEFLQLYQGWQDWDLSINPDDPMNPFVCEISLDSKGNIESDYHAMVKGYEWSQAIHMDFAQRYPAYHMNIDEIRIFNSYLEMDFNGNWEEAYQQIFGGNSINIFMPYGTSNEEINQFIQDEIEFFKSYFIEAVVVIVLKENDTYQMIQEKERLYLNMNRYLEENYFEIIVYVMK